MKKARIEGKKAFIRYTDGELIIDGKAHALNLDSEKVDVRSIPDRDVDSSQD